MSQKKVPFFFLNLEDLNKSPHVEHLKYILPYTEKSSQTSKMYWLEFLPRDAATYYTVSKKMIIPKYQETQQPHQKR